MSRFIKVMNEVVIVFANFSGMSTSKSNTFVGHCWSPLISAGHVHSCQVKRDIKLQRSAICSIHVAAELTIVRFSLRSSLIRIGADHLPPESRIAVRPDDHLGEFPPFDMVVEEQQVSTGRKDAI